MAEDTDKAEGAGAVPRAGDFNTQSRPSRTLQGVGAIPRARSFGAGGFGRQAFNDSTDAASLNIASPPPPSVVPVGEYPPGHKWHGPDMDAAAFPLSPETNLALRTHALNLKSQSAEPVASTTTEPLPVSPEPSASTSPSVVQGSGRGMAAASGRASGTITITPANAELDLAGGPVILERTLSERPEDIREAARALSKAITDQIDFLNDNKPNEPDPLARHNDLIAFLTQIAERLDGFADAIDAAVNPASSEREPFLLGTAANVARSVGDFVREGLTTHRAALQACAIQVPVLSLSVSLLHALGVDPTIAFGVIATIMGVKSDSKKQ
jgi:hypothetical protein